MSILCTPVPSRVGAAFGAPSLPSSDAATFGTPVHDRATAAALAAYSNYETDPPPPGGWTEFLKGLELRFQGSRVNLPDGNYDTDQTFFKVDKANPVWNVAVTKFVVMLIHPPSMTRYTIYKPVGEPGGFGAAWEFTLDIHPGGADAPPAAHLRDYPKRLVVKFFKDTARFGTAQEVERLERMQAIDAARLAAAAPNRRRGAGRQDISGDQPTPDRVQTRVLYDDLGVPCVVMPLLSGVLPYGKDMPVALAMEVIRAVFVDIENMYKRYQLLSFDLKVSNVLLDVRGGRVRVRAADFGGYSNVGAEVITTYPLPWNLKARVRELRDDSGKPYLDKEMFNTLSEEMSVYQLGTLLLELTIGYKTAIPMNSKYVQHSFLASMVDSSGGVNISYTKRYWGDVIRSPVWTPDAVAFLRYVTRYDDARGIGGSLERTTLAGLRDLLIPTEVIDLTGDSTMSAPAVVEPLTWPYQ
jgi:hypothetical protein